MTTRTPEIRFPNQCNCAEEVAMLTMMSRALLFAALAVVAWNESPAIGAEVPASAPEGPSANWQLGKLPANVLRPEQLKYSA